MSRLVPFVPSKAYYNFDTQLGDFAVTFDVHFNERAGLWFFDLLDDVGKEVIKGVAIVLGTNLGGRSQHPIFQRNILRAYDTAAPAGGAGRDATFDDIGSRVIVIHRTIEEFLNIGNVDPTD